MTKRQLQKNRTLFKWFEKRLMSKNLTPNSKNLLPDEKDFMRLIYEKYQQKLIKAKLIPGWNS